MTIQSEILKLVRASSAVSALVGAKVYWQFSPQPARTPYVVLVRTATEIGNTLGGTDGFRSMQFDAICVAELHEDADAIHTAVRDALIAHAGGALGGITYAAIMHVGLSDLQESPDTAEGDPLQLCAGQYQVDYMEE